MQHRPSILAVALVLQSATLLPCAEAGMRSFTIDGGGGSSSVGSFTLRATVGQPDACLTTTVGSYSLTSGFWHGGKGYRSWAAANIAPGLDSSFDGDADADGFPNGLLYIFGPDFELLSGGALAAPPGTVPADVVLILETSLDLVTWDPILRFDAGLETFRDPDVGIMDGVIIHTISDDARFYRYVASLQP